MLKDFDAKHNLELTLVGCVSGSGGLPPASDPTSAMGVPERRRDGHDVTQSKALLQVMEELQQKHIDHLDLIGKEFEKLEWPSFRRSPKRLDRAYSAQMALSGADVERAWNSFRRRAHSRCHSK